MKKITEIFQNVKNQELNKKPKQNRETNLTNP